MLSCSKKGNNMDIQVIKNDGSKENFDKSKIESVVTAAGLEIEQAKTFANNISNWVESKKQDSITSQEIRTKVYEDLKSVDEYTANFYHWYKKTENKPTVQNTSQ